MSIIMDEQDMRGHLRGLCLVAVVRHVGRAPKGSDFRHVLEETMGREVSRFTTAAAAFCGLESAVAQSAIDELYACDDEFLKPENLNMQLGLLSGRPVPVFPFISASGVHDVALMRPFLDVAKNLIHSAVRLRMQILPVSPAGAFWPVASRFLERAGGDTPTAKAIAATTLIDVASDVVFFNSDTASRMDDAVLASRVEEVLEELARVPLEVYTSGAPE